MKLRVNKIKLIKEGDNDKGHWILYGIKGYDVENQEQIDASMFGKEITPFGEGDLIEADITKKGKYTNLYYKGTIKSKEDFNKEESSMERLEPKAPTKENATAILKEIRDIVKNIDTTLVSNLLKEQGRAKDLEKELKDVYDQDEERYN